MFCHCTKSGKTTLFLWKMTKERTQPSTHQDVSCQCPLFTGLSFTLKQLLQAICFWRLQSALLMFIASSLKQTCTRWTVLIWNLNLAQLTGYINWLVASRLNCIQWYSLHHWNASIWTCAGVSKNNKRSFLHSYKWWSGVWLYWHFHFKSFFKYCIVNILIWDHFLFNFVNFFLLESAITE